MSKSFVRVTALVAASSLAMVANAANAQGTSVAEKQKYEEEIVVTGTRGSLESAERFKRDSDVLVDGISADDIGALPDESIADSLVRIPGLTANDDENGFSEVSVRGLGPDLANTTYNGRILPSTRFDSRRLDLGDLPTEGVSRAWVQKTASATTIEGGLGGTIGLESIHPLETRRRGLAVVLRASTDDVAQALDGVYGFKPIGYRGEASYVGRFADNFGIAVSYAHIRATRAAPSTQLVNPRTRTRTPDADGDGLFDIVPRNAGINMGAGTQERDSVIATAQWRPTPSLTATLDGYFISNGGQSSPINFISVNNDTVATEPTTYVAENSLVRKYVGYTSLYQETVNISRQKSQQVQGGFNLKWDNGGVLKAALDLSYARAKVSGHNLSATIKTLPNNPKRTAAGQIRPFAYDTTDPHNIAFDFGTQSPADYMLTDLNENNPNLTDTAKAARLDFKYDRELGIIRSMEFGVRADNRVKDNNPDGNAYTFGGLTTNPALDASYLVDKLAPLGEAAKWLGGVNAITFPLFDLNKLLAFRDHPNASYNEQVINDTRGDAVVEENSFAAYYQANIQTGRLRGNIGVRWFQTEVTVDGYAITANTAPVASQVKNKYDYFLPTMNLRYELKPNLMARLALGKTVSRPIFSAVRIGSAIDFTTVLPGDTVSRGNPDLMPYSSKNADLSLEWYPNKATSLAVQGFYKQVDNFIMDALIDGELEMPDGSFIPVVFNTNVNDPTVRHFYGFELIARRDLDFLPGKLSNLGVRVDYSHNWTDAVQDYQTVDGGRINLTPNNFTKETINGQLYYSTRGFDLRFAYRYYSPYMRENSNGYQSRPGGTLDVTTRVTLTRGIRLIGSVRNLTKSLTYSTQVDARYPDAYGIPRNVIYSGRTFTIGVRAQFK